MKKNLFLMLATVFLMSSLVYATVGGYKNIGEVSDFSTLEKDPGNSMNPLELRRGEQVILRGQFIAREPARQLNLKCFFVLKDTPMPIPAELNGMNLPLISGQMYECGIMFSLPKSMPSIPGQLKIAIEDETGRIYVGALINCKIY